MWTTEEKLATVAVDRGRVGQDPWEYIGTNYLLLGVIIEHATGRSVGEVLRSGVLDGDVYERLIYQPDERPTDPMAMPRGASADTFDERPEYGLGIWDRRSEYGTASGALGHTGLAREGYRTAALCFEEDGIVVVVLANAEGYDVDTTAGQLVQAAGP